MTCTNPSDGKGVSMTLTNQTSNSGSNTKPVIKRENWRLSLAQRDTNTGPRLGRATYLRPFGLYYCRSTTTQRMATHLTPISPPSRTMIAATKTTTIKPLVSVTKAIVPATESAVGLLLEMEVGRAK
ncbi:hypothetical protein VNO77_33430 [Canavalia gladiata]|uniref:Uncharacterized protein n=1 Tax=Canavalia gladiata TaxID=3824 RepID=A0AAN9PWD2_CANGL